tara:strand:+ start:162 stop:461 length:300 start_codon:yes stop_codon:yes gene_type:complete
MSDKQEIKAWLWEMTPKGTDNEKHTSMNDKVDMISIPIESNKLSLTEEPHPKILDSIKYTLKFKGNIRLSNSGTSYNLFRDVLDKDDDMVTFNVNPSPF